MDRKKTKNKRKNGYKCPVPKSTFTSYMDEGKIHFKASHFRKALLCFDRALKLKAKDRTALVARSQCHLMLSNPEAALKDAQASFNPEDDDADIYLKGLYQYGDALYNLGRFEDAIIVFHRGRNARPDKLEFKVGIQRCKDAIRLAIGDIQGTQVEDLDMVLPIIDEMEALLAGTTGKCCVLPTDNEKEWKKGTPPKVLRRKGYAARSRWVDREILGVVHKDKAFLDKFLKRPDIKGNTQRGSRRLRTTAKDALDYLQSREDFWRQEHPMYARRVGLNFNNDMVSQFQQEELARMAVCRRIKMDAAENAIAKHVTQIEHALKIDRPKDCQLECDRAIRQMNKMTYELLPRKAEFMTEILHYKGLALMKLKEYRRAANAFKKQAEIATTHKMNETRARALDFQGKSLALKGAYNEAAEVWDTRLSLAKTAVERAYLFHEIGRCYYETKKIDLAKLYGIQALEEAVDIDDHIWAMNAAVLMAQCEVKVKELENAGIFFAMGAEHAQKCGHKENVVLLAEAYQCIKIYLEKKDTFQPEPPSRRNSDSESSDDSDDIFGDKFYF